MKFDKRLERLERKVPDAGCPKRRHRRGRLVFVECRRQQDGHAMTMPGRRWMDLRGNAACRRASAARSLDWEA
jgi:hypothetical protein